MPILDGSKPRPAPYTVRFANDNEHAAICRLLPRLPAKNWTAVYPHWLVSLRDGEYEGCIEVLYGRPTAMIDNLGLSPILTRRQRAIVGRDLIWSGLAVCKHYGANHVIGCLRPDEPTWRRIWLRRGCHELGLRHLFIKDLTNA